MRAEEAVREWCIDRAISIVANNHPTAGIKAKDVIEEAKKLEKYITE